MDIKDYHVASSLQNAYEILSSSKKNVLIGGGAWLKRGSQRVEVMVDLKDLALASVIEHKDYLEIGAMTTLRDLETSQVIKNIGNGYLASAINKIMGVGFRNVATVGGSIVGKYPFSDLLTPLITLDVELIFYPKRKITLFDYLKAKGKTTDILTHILIKKNKCKGYFKKVSNTVLDFAIINVAVTKENNQYKIAIGARPGIALLAEEAMEYLNEQSVITKEVVTKLGEIISETINFSSNRLADKDYRKIVAITYVKRGIKEVSNYES